MSKTQRMGMATAPNSEEPLAIQVTDEGSEFVQLRALALEAVPMLLRPEAYPKTKREQIASGFRQVLEDDCLDTDSDFAEYGDEENEGYEPGECLLWPDEEDI